jgi:hypothetical protein
MPAVMVVAPTRSVAVVTPVRAVAVVAGGAHERGPRGVPDLSVTGQAVTPLEAPNRVGGTPSVAPVRVPVKGSLHDLDSSAAAPHLERPRLGPRRRGQGEREDRREGEGPREPERARYRSNP